MDLIRRVGINQRALPVAEQASQFIAPRSTIDAALRGKERVGHRKWGSDATAASGGVRELSEWPGSARHESVLTGEVTAGDPNRVISSFRLRNDTLIGSVYLP